jgi:hypothetical protein
MIEAIDRLRIRIPVVEVSDFLRHTGQFRIVFFLVVQSKLTKIFSVQIGAGSPGKLIACRGNLFI